MSLNGVSFTSLIKIRPPHLFPVFFVVVLVKRQRKSEEILFSFDCNVTFMISKYHIFYVMVYVHAELKFEI